MFPALDLTCQLEMERSLVMGGAESCHTLGCTVYETYSRITSECEAAHTVYSVGTDSPVDVSHVSAPSSITYNVLR